MLTVIVALLGGTGLMLWVLAKAVKDEEATAASRHTGRNRTPTSSILAEGWVAKRPAARS